MRGCDSPCHTPDRVFRCAKPHAVGWGRSHSHRHSTARSHAGADAYAHHGSDKHGQESLGISNTAAQDVIRAVGNYGEIYARNLGPNGINLPRSDGDRNALWSAAPCEDCPKGGQIYSAPLR